jgi:hypothetical protein
MINCGATPSYDCEKRRRKSPTMKEIKTDWVIEGLFI